MAGKKKKGGKGKKGGDGAKGGGLPPPPNLEQTRQGAAEALLSFQIQGKEESVGQYEEEAEVYKDKNYQQKDRNYQLKQQQAVHYKTLVDGARKLEVDIDHEEVVERHSVDAALEEKLELAKQFDQKLAGIESRIIEVSESLQVGIEDKKTWEHFKDHTFGERQKYIARMKEQMKCWEIDEEQLQMELDSRLTEAKDEVDKRSRSLEERKKEQASERVMQNLDKETKSEMSDNTWLHNQVSIMQRTVDSLRRETDALEHRNIKLIKTVSDTHNSEVVVMSDIYNMTTGRGLPSRQAGSNGLPSLVNVAKCTSDQGSGGQVGQYEMQLLSLSGSRPPFHGTPDDVHLPPIEKQRSSHTALPPRTNWPISNAMLSSVLTAE